MEITLKNLETLEFIKTPTVVIYKKSKTSKKFNMVVTLKDVDTVNNSRANKPIIDHKYEIVELGVGVSFIKLWLKTYKLNKFNFFE